MKSVTVAEHDIHQRYSNCSPSPTHSYSQDGISRALWISLRDYSKSRNCEVVPVVKVETGVEMNVPRRFTEVPGGVTWPGQAPGSTFSGDLWGNLPFCTFRGDRQLTWSWRF